jgi:hypothetical protein
MSAVTEDPTLKRRGWGTRKGNDHVPVKATTKHP